MDPNYVDESVEHDTRTKAAPGKELKISRRTALGKMGLAIGGLSVLTTSAAQAEDVSSQSTEKSTNSPLQAPLEGAPPPVPLGNKKPNILVFFTDQQRWDTTGTSGNTLGLTPNFDRVAGRGAYLENYSTCQPVCGPARSCMQTGLFATQTGVWRNGPALDPTYTDTLAKIFTTNGYDTGYIGKWHLGGTNGFVPVANRGGYDYWWASEVLEITADAYGGTVWDTNGNPVQTIGYRADALTDNAIQYLSSHANSGKPFFLTISYIEPHQENKRDDFPAPDVYKDTYKGLWNPKDLSTLPSVAPGDPDCFQRCGPGYLGMIKRVDECLGRVLDSLKSLGLDDDTVVVYTADHGNHFKTRNHEYKRSCHEASIRLPGAIQGPGYDGVGKVTDLVSLIDFAPTVLDAAGIPVPSQMQGHALGARLRGELKSWPDDVYIQISESQTGRAVRNRQWKYGVDSHPHRISGPTADVYVEQYLYDLDKDPYEVDNLAGKPEYAEVAEQMQGRLKWWMKKAGEPDAVIVRSAPAAT